MTGLAIASTSFVEGRTLGFLRTMPFVSTTVANRFLPIIVFTLRRITPWSLIISLSVDRIEMTIQTFVRFLRPDGQPVRKNEQSVINCLVLVLVLAIDDGEGRAMHTFQLFDHGSFHLNLHQIGTFWREFLSE